MKIIYFILLCLMLVAPFRASAEDMPELTNYLKNEITSSSKAFQAPIAKAAGSQDELFFRRWFLRLQANFGISVPWIATFQIIPEVELVFQRAYPDGWQDYSPFPVAKMSLNSDR
jgi:hypothetical protein